MSTTAPALPDTESARQLVFQEAWADAFFGKLASLGHQPHSVEEQTALLDIAGMVQAEEAQGFKQAAAGPYSQVRDALAGHLNNDNSPQRQLALAKQAAASMLTDPRMYNAVLALEVERLQAAG